MKKSALLLSLVFLVFSGCNTAETETTTSSDTQETDEFGLIIGQEEEAQAAQALKMKEVACEDSGGTFAEETCTCPDDTYGEKNWPLYTYDEKTGYCMDAFGLPGGALGEEAKEKNPAGK